MNNMREITGASWRDAVTEYNGKYAVIELSNNNNTFTLISDNAAVNTFFGGTYHRQ